MKKFLALTVATVVASSGCGYLESWRCNGGWGSFRQPYCDGVACEDGIVYGGEGGLLDGGLYDGNVVYDGGVPSGYVGPGAPMFAPGESIPAPSGEMLPEPAQR